MRTNIYQEITSDKGCKWERYASNNSATYILTSAYAHDMYYDFVQKYGRIPSSQWYHRHFNFERVQE